MINIITRVFRRWYRYLSITTSLWPCNLPGGFV